MGHTLKMVIMYVHLSGIGNLKNASKEMVRELEGLNKWICQLYLVLDSSCQLDTSCSHLGGGRGSTEKIPP